MTNFIIIFCLLYMQDYITNNRAMKMNYNKHNTNIWAQYDRKWLILRLTNLSQGISKELEVGSTRKSFVAWRRLKMRALFPLGTRYRCKHVNIAVAKLVSNDDSLQVFASTRFSPRDISVWHYSPERRKLAQVNASFPTVNFTKLPALLMDDTAFSSVGIFNE